MNHKTFSTVSSIASFIAWFLAIGAIAVLVRGLFMRVVQ